MSESNKNKQAITEYNAILKNLNTLQCPSTWPYVFFSIFQTICHILSLFLYFYCNDGKFYLGGLLGACYCPQIYIAYKLALCVYKKK